MIPILITLVRVLEFIIIARALVSWIRVDPYNPVVRILHDITEPLLAPIRKLLPQGSMMDLSPFIALLILVVVRTILRSLLF